MLIEDKELRSLYEAASSEHLENLETGILHLEKHPHDLSHLKDLLRAAHSLKGDSRMLGVKDAETLTHQLETLLQSAQAGQPVTPELCDRLYQGLDAIRQIADSAVTGEPCSVNTFQIMTLLMGGSEAEPEVPASSQTSEPASAQNRDQESDEIAAFAAAVALASHNEQAQTEVLHEELLQAKQFQEEVARLAALGDVAEEETPTSISEAPISYLIEDEELRRLYEVASAEHLDTLEEGCLHLEKHPDDRSRMKELLRAAHSLKGDSRMLGVKDAETLTHQLETLLQEVEQGQQEVDARFCDRLYKGLDSIRKIAHSAVTGEGCQLNLFEVMAQLMGAEAVAAPTSVQEAAAQETAAHPLAKATESQQGNQPSAMATTSTATARTSGSDDPISSPAPAKHPAQPAQSNTLASTTASTTASTPANVAAMQRSETIRVASAKLDSLITQVSELSVAKRRIIDWSGSVTEMLDFWEGWTREAFVHQLSFGHLQDQLAPEVAQPLQAFYQQNQNRIEQLGHYVQQFRGQTSEDGARLDSIAGDLEAGIRNLRMLPLSNVFSLFRRMVRDLSTQQGKDVNFIIEGGETQVDKRIIEEVKDPLSHLLRNAIDHGIETTTDRLAAGKPPTATLRLRGYRQGSSVIIDITDDGQGLDIQKIRQTALRRGICTEASLAKMTQQQIQFLIFAPGFSTRTQVSEISGRGVGLDVVRTNIESLKGSIGVDSKPHKGCRFRLTLNPSLATTEALLLSVNQTSYAMPIEYVDRMVTVDRDKLFAIKGNLTTTIDDEPISVAWLSDLLELPASIPTSVQEADQIAEKIPCVILKIGSKRLGLFVDRLIDQQEIILKPQSKLLQRIRNLTGSTILGNGEVCLVLNPQDLFKTALKQNGALETFEQISSAANQLSRILLVEDSIPIRTQVKRILEGAGYEVTATVDGLDGYNTLRNQEEPFAAVVSDVEMPNLTGLELAAKIRQHSEYDDLPVVLVTTLATAEDRQRGKDAGANAYITKGDFDQNLLLDTLRGLIQS